HTRSYGDWSSDVCSSDLLIANGVLALLRHPEELARLRRDPSLIRSAVEELLRYDSPIHSIARFTREPYEVGGVAIPEREQLMLRSEERRVGKEGRARRWP